MSHHLYGAVTGEVYDLGDAGASQLRNQRDLLITHFGSLSATIVSIAAMLEQDGSPALVILALLHAAKEMHR